MQKIKQGIVWQIRRIINYFLKGLLISLPVIVTYKIIKTLVITLDEFLELETPGLGILIVITSLIFIGIVGSSFIIQPLLDVLDDIFSKIPFVKIIYTSVKDLIEAFVGEKKKFNKPVLVEFTSGVYKPGFVTQDDCNEFNLPEITAVYFPHSYAFSGNVFLVECNKIKPYKGNQADFMKYIISGAVTKIGSTANENNN
ncbi:MAG: DUF502 domain-containing protein [Bacteroidia bacterium]